MTAIELEKNVEKALDEIRPFLENDGGNIGVEMTIKKYAPQIEQVIDIS